MMVAFPASPAQIPGPTTGDKKRQQQQALAWKAYRGDFEPQLTKEQDEPDFNVMPNLCAPIVTTGSDFLFGKSVTIAVDESAPHGAADALKAAWGDEDDYTVFFQKLALNGGICGHVFVQITAPKDKAQHARFVILDPQNVSVQYAVNDCDYVQAYIIQYPIPVPWGASKLHRQVFQRVEQGHEEDVVAPERAETSATPEEGSFSVGTPVAPVTWIITDYEGSSESTLHATGAPVLWRLPFAPIQHCQNLPLPNEFWGQPDLTPSIIRMNLAYNLVESNINKIVWYHGHPWVWASGFNPSGVKMRPGDLIPIQSPEGKMGAVEAHGDVASARDFAADLRSDMDEDSGIPGWISRSMEMPKGAVSGVALEIFYQRPLSKTMTKRRLYGELIRKLSQIHLYFAGFDADGNTIPVHLHWPDLLPIDDAGYWQSTPMKQMAGVSNTTIQLSANLDPELERLRRQQEAQHATDDFNAGLGPPPATQAFTQQADSSSSMNAGGAGSAASAPDAPAAPNA